MGARGEVREDPTRLIGRERRPPERVQIHTRGETLELFFPPLRMISVALPLAAFGVIAGGLAAVGAAVMVAGDLTTGAGILGAVLLAGFVAPFALFGLTFVLLAIYMMANALTVQIDPRGARSERKLFGFTVRQSFMRRDVMRRIEPRILSRHQSLFSGAAFYQLVAYAAGGETMTLAEGLHGEEMMNEVRQRIESALVLPRTGDEQERVEP